MIVLLEVNMKEKVNEIKVSLEKAVEDLSNIEKDVSEWNLSCDLTEAIRSINVAIRRLNSVGEEE